MKRRLSLLLLVVVMMLSTLSFVDLKAEDAKYSLSGGTISKAFTSSDELVTYMKTFTQEADTEYTLTLNDDLIVPTLSIEEYGNTYNTLNALELKGKITINGNGHSIKGADGAIDGSRLVMISEESTVNINDLNFDGEGKYSAIANATLDDYYDNTGTTAKINTYLSVNNCKFNKCRANDADNYKNINGSALFLIKTKLLVIDSDFIDFECMDDGGAIFLYNCKAEIKGVARRSTISKGKLINGGSNGGGAICTIKGKLSLDNIDISDCTSISNGGAVAINSSYVEFNKVDFSNCSSNSNGGAISIIAWDKEDSLYDTVLKLKEVHFNDCKASQNGGAVYLDTDCAFKFDTLNFYKCKANEGGAIYAFSPKDIDEDLQLNKRFNIRNSRFEENASEVHGGAIYLERGPDANGTVYIRTSDFINNETGGYGGAIYTKYHKLNIVNSNFNNNKAIEPYVEKHNIDFYNGPSGPGDGKGGAIYYKKATSTIVNSNFKGNMAMKGGALGIANYISALNPLEPQIMPKVIIYGGEISDNHASKVGGGIYFFGENFEYKYMNYNESETSDPAPYPGTPGGNQDPIVPPPITPGPITPGPLPPGGGPHPSDPKPSNYLDYMKKLAPYLEVHDNVVFKGNLADLGYYNSPKLEDLMPKLFNRDNSCSGMLMKKADDDKWIRVESLINNYDIDFINPKISIVYDSNDDKDEQIVEELDLNINENDYIENVSAPDITCKTIEEAGFTNAADFLGWSRNKNASEAEFKAGDPIKNHKGSITLFAIRKKVRPAPSENYNTLSLDENYRGGDISKHEVFEGELIDRYLYRPRRRGYVFRGWSYNKRYLDEVRESDRIYRDTRLYAIWEKEIEEEEEPIEIKGEDHKAYIFGYPNGTVRPNGSITRAEAAAMLARLLNIEAIGSAAKPQFTDTESSWYNKAINVSVFRGIMKGYPDGRFRPNAPISRAEFTQMISTIDNKPYGVAPFADVPGHWAERAIGSEYQAKRITGYPDGLFRPDANITRAEAAVILNKIFERKYDNLSLLKCKNPQMIKRFTDLDETFWGWNDMVEATNTHEFVRRYKEDVLKRLEEDWLLIK